MIEKKNKNKFGIKDFVLCVFLFMLTMLCDFDCELKIMNNHLMGNIQVIQVIDH